MPFRWSSRGDLGDFDFVEPPCADSVDAARVLLVRLGLVHLHQDGKLELTGMGHNASRLQMEPRCARTILAAIEEGCVREAAGCVALLADGIPRRLLPEHRQAKEASNTAEREDARKAALRAMYTHEAGDHFTLLNVLHDWEKAAGSNNLEPGPPSTFGSTSGKSEQKKQTGAKWKWSRPLKASRGAVSLSAPPLPQHLGKSLQRRQHANDMVRLSKAWLKARGLDARSL